MSHDEENRFLQVSFYDALGEVRFDDKRPRWSGFKWLPSLPRCADWRQQVFDFASAGDFDKGTTRFTGPQCAVVSAHLATKGRTYFAMRSSTISFGIVP